MRQQVQFALIFALLSALSACKPAYTVAPKVATKHRRSHHKHHSVETATAHLRAEYRDIQEDLASLKQEVKGHIHVFEESKNSDDPLNRREDADAHREVLDSAMRLRDSCDAALANGAMLKVVSGSKRNLRRYKAYATEVLAMYDKPEPAPEAPSTDPPAQNDAGAAHGSEPQ